MEIEDISVQDFSIWKNLIVTKFVFQTLSEVHELNKATLSSTEFQMRSTDIERGRMVGLIEALDMVLNLEFDENQHKEEVE